MPKVGIPLAKRKQLQHKSEVFCGDYFQWLSMPQNRQRRFKLIFADPPFNIGQDYAGYDDKQPEAEFRLWIGKTVSALATHCDGALALHGPDSLVEVYLSAARTYHPIRDFKRIAWVNWHYRFGNCSRKNWIDSRCHCLIYSKGEHRWNPEDVLVESDRATKYADKRVLETANGGMRLPFTIWGLPSDGEGWGRVQGTSKERCPERPNQLPEKYMERLIRAYTVKGDWIFDPFGGTGTTAVVAQELGRNFVTCDVSEEACQVIRDRLNRGVVSI